MRIFPALAFLLLSQIARAEPVKLVYTDIGNVEVCVGGDPKVSYRMQSDCKGEGMRAGHKTMMSFNHLGLRDKDYPPVPAGGTFRILVVGSSSLVGPGIDEIHTPVRQMEKELRLRGFNVEVINGATEGYFTTQNAIRLQEFLDAYHPQMVIYDFSPSVGVFTDAAQATITTYENGAPVAIHAQPLSWFPQALHGRIYANQKLFRIFQTLDELWRRIGATWRARMAGIIARNPMAKAARFLSETERLLKYMKAASEKAHAVFYVSVDPDAPATTRYNVPPYINFGLATRLSRLIVPVEVPNELVQERMRSFGVRVIPVSRQVGPELTLPGDYHYNEAGGDYAGKVMADAFAGELRALAGAPKPAPGAGKGRPRGKAR